MDLFNKLFPQPKKLSQEQLQLKVLLKDLSLTDLEKIAKEYISRDPKVSYKDSDGLMKTRKPNRNDLVNAIINNVSLEGVCKVFPKLKDKI